MKVKWHRHEGLLKIQVLDKLPKIKRFVAEQTALGKTISIDQKDLRKIGLKIQVRENGEKSHPAMLHINPSVGNEVLFGEDCGCVTIPPSLFAELEEGRSLVVHDGQDPPPLQVVK